MRFEPTVHDNDYMMNWRWVAFGSSKETRLTNGSVRTGQAGKKAEEPQLPIETISRFGFRRERGGPHLARTMMLDELKLLFGFVEPMDSGKDLYVRSIIKDNCLNKRSERTSSKTNVEIG